MKVDKEPLRIVYLWDADYPWDVRTEKVCSALRDSGMEVHIVARNRARRDPQATLAEAVVHRMKPWPVLNDISGFPAFFNPRWIRHLREVNRRVKPHVIIARDLPLCATAVWAGRRERVPVMLDMAENYPAMMADLWITGTHRPWDVLVRNPAIVRAVENKWLPQVDHVLVVVEESADRLERDHHLSPDRITIVSNTPSRARVTESPPSSHDPINVVYLGLMELPRGVGDLLEAQAILKKSGTAVRLRLIGDGRDMETLRAHAGRLNLSESDVEFTGRLEHAEALRLVATSDIGVVPHHANESWNTTIPNKLFDYMAAGLAVVTSDAVPCRRIVQSTGAGRVFRSGDAGDLARSIRVLLDARTRHQHGANGRRAVRTRHNWESDSQRLIAAVRATAGSAAGNRQGPGVSYTRARV